jgi:threonine dehydrogenase-like Zn-dependent dehydrogenase
MVKKGGNIILVAMLNEVPLSFKGYDLIGKEINLRGSIMSNHADVKEALELAASGRVDVEAIATHILPIDEAQTGILMVKNKSRGAIKVILKFEDVKKVTNF